MKYLTPIACLAIIFFVFPGNVASESMIGWPSIRDLPLGASTTELLAERAADAYGINKKEFVATMKCESAGWQDIQSGIPKAGGPNGQENSWGIAQINLPAHPDISIYDALDVRWSLNWAAKQWSEGHARLWTCARLLGYTK